MSDDDVVVLVVLVVVVVVVYFPNTKSLRAHHPKSTYSVGSQRAGSEGYFARTQGPCVELVEAVVPNFPLHRCRTHDEKEDCPVAD